jgi:hypothetical protein
VRWGGEVLAADAVQISMPGVLAYSELLGSMTASSIKVQVVPRRLQLFLLFILHTYKSKPKVSP